MGQEYAAAPANYEAPAANNAGTGRNGNSGSVQVGGYFFNWDINSGFSGEGWQFDVGPMKCWPFTTDAEVREYLQDMEATTGTMNLNAVFSKWHDWYYTAGEAGLNDYEAFVDRLSYGCKVMA